MKINSEIAVCIYLKIIRCEMRVCHRGRGSDVRGHTVEMEAKLRQGTEIDGHED